MPIQGLSIIQAADRLGVSTRTIRRYIKAGKIKAKLIDGRFGGEYCILELPSELHKTGFGSKVTNHSQDPSQIPIQAVDIIRELQEKNLALAARLGAATERIKNLEEKVKLLTTARVPLWKRLFNRTIG